MSIICSSDYGDLQYYLFLSCASLSFFGSVYVIKSCIQRNLLNIYSFKVIFYMAINDVVRSLAISVPVHMESIFSAYCEELGYIISVTFVSNTIWAACISLTLYQVVVLKIEYYEKFQKFWLVLSYIVLPLLEGLPFITNSYGYDDGFCSLRNNIYADIWRLTIIYIPGWLLIFLVLFLFIKIRSCLKPIQKNPTRNIILERGYIYAIIIILLLIPLTVQRILQVFDDSCPSIYLSVFSYGLVALHGFFNAVVFSKNKVLKNDFYNNLNEEYNSGTHSFVTGSSINTLPISNEVSMQRQS